MADLKKPAIDPNPALRQVIFVHGLNGDSRSTWSAGKDAGMFWPDWLAEDIPGTAVWSLGYAASASQWQRDGAAMALPDRAANVLPTLLSELGHTSGDIIFVGYSMGGLVAQATIRLADTLAPHDERTAAFLRRVRGLVLLGTPNSGSNQATILKAFSFVTRPRETLSDLTRDNAYLRDLNTWTRSFVPSRRIKALVIRESRPIRWLGLIVAPSSADPGLAPSVSVIPVDADHVSLSHPESRQSEVYRHIANFLRGPPGEPHPDTLLADGLGKVQESVVGIRSELAASNEVLVGVRRDVEKALGNNAENAVITKEALRRLTQLRQIRFAPGVNAITICRGLLKAVETGELSSASTFARQSIFAWCSRLLASVDLKDCRIALSNAEQFGISEETLIAKALLLAHSPESKRAEALSMLAPVRTPEARAALLFIAVLNETPVDGLSWLRNVGFAINEVHPDGKHRILGLQLDAREDEAALATANSLRDDDFRETPCLLFAAANVYLSQAIHPDLRNILQLALPMQPAIFPLADDAAALEYRAKAIASYKAAAAAFALLEADTAADIASDRALWLELRDPALKEGALKVLQQSMADEIARLRRLPLALAFGLEVNFQAVERDIDQALALSGGTSSAAAVARFTLAMESKGPEIADHIARHRPLLVQYYDPSFIDSVEIEALARTGRGEEARSKLADFEAADPDSDYLSKLKQIVTNELSADTAAEREVDYLAQPTVPALINLVDDLKRSKKTTKLAHYAEMLFEELKDVSSAEAYTTALYHLDADDKIVELAEAHPGIIAASETLQTNAAWAYYRIGRLKDSGRLLGELQSRRDAADDRRLLANITIASGDWSLLNGLVEEEWQNRNERDTSELLHAGILAGRIGSKSRSQELIREAARRAGDNAEILGSCYTVASSAGWEDEEAHGWLATAIQNSGEDGPIQKVDLNELVEQQPIWNKRIAGVWDQLVRGEIPIFAAAKFANRTLLDLFLRPAIQNLGESDPRKRSLIFAFGATKPTSSVKGKRLAIDVTALLTLTLTGQLRRVLEWSDRVVVAHTTLVWLFHERDKLAFHQPSLLRRARELKLLIDAGRLHQFEGSAPPLVIEKEVGDEIARYLVAAQTIDALDKSQKIVIASFPLPKPGTLLQEHADISGLEEHFAGCADVLVALKRGGHLTDAEMTTASSYIQLQEKPWPHNPTLEAGATLYLNDLAVAYFQHLQLLTRLSHAGFKVIISSSEIERANELVRFDASADEARRLVEELQTLLRDGISSGKIKLGKLPRGEQQTAMLDPMLSMVASMPDVDALVVDDRFFNRHTAMDLVPIATSIDVLATMVMDGVLTSGDLMQIRTRLRQAGASFVPFEAGEIEALLRKTTPNQLGGLEETAELRAIRQSITRIRMTDALQLPSDSVWIDSLTRELVWALRAQWTEGISDETARARSLWICALLDVRGWAHVSAASGIGIKERYLAQLVMLLMSPSSQPPVRKRYWKWLQDYALDNVKDEAPELYRKLLDAVKDAIADQVNDAEDPSDGK